MDPSNIHILRLHHLAQVDGEAPTLLEGVPAFAELRARRRKALEEWLDEVGKENDCPSNDSQG
jgi:hypothetical protein